MKGKTKGFKKQKTPRKKLSKQAIVPVKGKTVVKFPPNPSGVMNFDFTPWYGTGIDAITSACQGGIQSKLNSCGEEEGDSVATVVKYCNQGLNEFLSFFAAIAKASSMEMTLDDVDQDLIDLYIAHLRTRPAKTDTGLLSYTSQKTIYDATKSVLEALCTLQLLPPAEKLFPASPFPGSNGRKKGQKSFSDSELRPLVAALKTDLEAIQEGWFKGSMSQALSAVLLGISLRTGINTTPLLSISRDALIDHPVLPDHKVLVIYKRRGNSTYKQTLRWSIRIKGLAVARTDVITLYEWALKQTKPLLPDAGNKHKDQLWLYRSEKTQDKGKVTALSADVLRKGIKAFVERHNLKADDGTPLKMNLTRMRKTFVKRIYLLSGRDPLVAARCAGHTVKVHDESYWEVTSESELGFKFMGEIWLDTLRGKEDDTTKISRISKHKLKKSENTPVARCRDPKYGDRAPKNGKYCSRFANCFGCKSIVVTGDDLYRLYSFYWLVIKERRFVPVPHWKRLYRSVVRIVDDVITPKFPAKLVEEVRNKARTNPHPFWRDREMLIISGQDI